MKKWKVVYSDYDEEKGGWVKTTEEVEAEDCYVEGGVLVFTNYRVPVFITTDFDRVWLIGESCCGPTCCEKSPTT